MTARRHVLTALLFTLLLGLVAGPAAAGGAIASGETRNGTITTPGALDVWTFAGTAGQRVLITAVETSSAFDSHIQLYPPSGPLEADAGCPFGVCNNAMSWQLAQTGTYTIVISDGPLTRPGTYRITLQQLPGPSTFDPEGDGGALRSGVTAHGWMNVASDLDAYSFFGLAGERIIVTALTLSGSLDTHLQLYPPAGGPIEVDAGCPFGVCNNRLDAALAGSGIYTILVSDAALTNTGEYALTFTRVGCASRRPRDPDGGPIAIGQTRAGSIQEPSDLDLFQFYGAAGDRVLISAVTTGGSLDTYLQLFPPDDGPAEAGSSCPFGVCGDLLDHALAKSGLYTILVADGSLAQTGAYNLTLNKIPATPRAGLYNPSPADGAMLALPAMAPLQWDPVTGATGYEIRFGTDVSESLAVLAADQPGTTHPMPALTHDRVYYWRVVTHTTSGDIEGPCWYFYASDGTTDTPPLAANGLGISSTPNPARGDCQVVFRLERDATVTLDVHDVLGARVRRLAAGRWPAGAHRIQWDGRSEDGRLAPPGLYYLRLETTRTLLRSRLALLR